MNTKLPARRMGDVKGIISCIKFLIKYKKMEPRERTVFDPDYMIVSDDCASSLGMGKGS